MKAGWQEAAMASLGPVARGGNKEKPRRGTHVQRKAAVAICRTSVAGHQWSLTIALAPPRGADDSASSRSALRSTVAPMSSRLSGTTGAPSSDANAATMPKQIIAEQRPIVKLRSGHRQVTISISQSARHNRNVPAEFRARLRRLAQCAGIVEGLFISKNRTVGASDREEHQAEPHTPARNALRRPESIQRHRLAGHEPRSRTQSGGRTPGSPRLEIASPTRALRSSRAHRWSNTAQQGARSATPRCGSLVRHFVLARIRASSSMSIDVVRVLQSRRLRPWLVGGAAAAAASAAALWLSSSAASAAEEGRGEDEDAADDWPYEELQALMLGRIATGVTLPELPLPAMLVNVDVYDSNCDLFASMARAAGKTIRIASKSVRVPALLERALRRHPDIFQGLMCFSVPEAVFWSRRGIKDLLVAYPTVQTSDLRAATAAQAADPSLRLCLMVDCPDHVHRIAAFAREADTEPLRLCLDLDVSYRPFGGLLHLGAHRSPCRASADVVDIAAAVRANSDAVTLEGMMAYEAQIAGVMDRNPYEPLTNAVASTLKWLSLDDVRSKRAVCTRSLLVAGIPPLRFVNGGGTGCAQAACADESCTEITVGSGLLQSQIFDWFAASRAKPAFAFALRVTRISDQGATVCCQSGGFIASGSTGRDKNPRPFRPRGLTEFEAEGFGEVQTPLRVSDPDRIRIALNDAILLRPAKAGEIAERFDHYVLLSRRPPDASDDRAAVPSSSSSLPHTDAVDAPAASLTSAPLLRFCKEAQAAASALEDGRLRVVDVVPTYRGLGLSFY